MIALNLIKKYWPCHKGQWCTVLVILGITLLSLCSTSMAARDDEGPCSDKQIASGEYRTIKLGSQFICEFIGGTTEEDLPEPPVGSDHQDNGSSTFPGWVRAQSGSCGGSDEWTWLGHHLGEYFSISVSNVEDYCDQPGDNGEYILTEDGEGNIEFECWYPEGDGFTCFGASRGISARHYQCQPLLACNLNEDKASFTQPWQVSWSGVDADFTVIHEHYKYNPSDLGFGDFNSDGKTDIFYVENSKWYVWYSDSQTVSQINNSKVKIKDLGFGDFDGDGKTDIFRAPGNKWYVSYGGTSRWQQLNTSGFRLKDLSFGDFNGDGKTDVFRATGSKWYVSYGGTGRWQQLNSQPQRIEDIKFVDYNNDGKTDVFRVEGNTWYISYAGAGQWVRIYQTGFSEYNLSTIKFGDFDGDGKTDIFVVTGDRWEVHFQGRPGLREINDNQVIPPQKLRLGDFDGDGISDVFFSRAPLHNR